MALNREQPRPYSPTDFAAHLACAHLTQLEQQRRAGTLSIAFPTDPRLEALQVRGRLLEAAYIEKLRSQGRVIHDLRETRDPAATIAAMREGVEVIVQAPLANGKFFGIADVLLRCERPSNLGAYSYEPVDTKLARETRATTMLQLMAYCEMLDASQGIHPTYFHVVTPLKEETYRAADFGAYYRFIRARFEAATTGSPSPDTYPDPVSHCDVCRYGQHCDAQRRRDDHPSLIAGIHTAHVREFQSQDIPTVVAIGGIEGKLPNEPRRGRRETYAGLGQQARLQVEARSTPVPPVELLPLETGRGFARLPAPSQGDIFLDFEGDPFAGENGLEYLIGFHVRGANGTPVLEQQWAFDGQEEKVLCERFLDFASAQLARHQEMHIYHFGAYEPTTLKRVCARYETRGTELDQFLRGGRFIDLHTVVRESMRIGVERYGLKELEALHDFTRKQDLAEASISRRDVELAIELGDTASISGELRERVARYNAEDCYSTESLRDWLETRRRQHVADGHAIERPALQLPDASDAVTDRDMRIWSLKEQLAAKLPSDRAAWKQSDEAIALLASMLGYFRQEEKNIWWEHYRLRELPETEWLEERQMISGLNYVETLPKAGRQTSERRRYRFPFQESKIDAGKTVYFTKYEDPVKMEGSGTALKVEELDSVTSTIVLSSSKFQPGKHPTVVFLKQAVGPIPPLENALLSFAEHVRDHGLVERGPLAASCALLRHSPPRSAHSSGSSLRTPGEETLVAAKRLCVALDNEVLPIQGPPGSGKTYTGARAIAELARRGSTIGITAVSHKVIDNLLSAVSKATTGHLRLVHKNDGEPPGGIDYVRSAEDAFAAIAPGSVVGGTVWLWADVLARGQLDYLFIDEAGQMSLANALAATGAARNVVLLGDPQQLEQPQKGAHPEGADVAALVHLVGKSRATLEDDQGLFLDSTFRLHPAICDFTSEIYYEDRLVPVPGRDRQRLDGATHFSGSGLFLVETPHEGNQAVAKEEVDKVASIIESLLGSGTTWTDCDGVQRPLLPSDLLVVAPYNAQVSKLRTCLAPLGVDRVGTVDRFQGQEAPVVIYSCTSSSAEDAPRGMAFLYDPHRFNVATSRAQGVVIVVASPRLFEVECKTPEQMRWANGLCRYREMATLI
ncbi:MAG: TM0106 family RecB-like putative nuclease [Usitatibacter sp.]